MLRTTSALVAAGFFATPALAQTRAIDQAFPPVVAEILSGQAEGPISEMNHQHKQAMIKCVNGVLKPLARGKKRFIVAGEDYEEREKRFGKVLYENRAEWVQAIARGCADTALSRDYD